MSQSRAVSAPSNAIFGADAVALVCALGAGYENIAVAYAKTRGIVVVNGAGTNDDGVADHAVGLLIAAVRGIPMWVVGHPRPCRPRWTVS